MNPLSRTSPRLVTLHRALYCAFFSCAVFSCALLLAACPGKKLPPLETVAHPELSGADEAVRRQLGDARAALDQAVAKGEAPAAAAAFGSLGELYLAYEYGAPAAACLRNAEKLDPGSFVWTYEQGLAARAAGDAATARGHFERALAKNPVYAPAQAHLAESAPGSFADPLRERLDGLTLSAAALGKRGNLALADGRLQDAEAAFRRGIAANPDHAALRLDLALTLVRQGRLDDALAALQETLGRDGNNARAHHDLGTVYRAKNQNEEALAAFRRALELDPGYASAQFNLANTLIALERWGEAAPAVDRTLQLTPQDRRARYLQAMVLRARGQAPAAIERLRALLAEDPADRTAREGLTDTLAAAGKTAEALELYRATAALPATSKEDAIKLLDDAAKLAWRKNLRDQSVLLWRQAIEKDPGSSQAHLNLGNGLQLLNRRDEAKAELAKAVELNPRDSNARLSLAALRILTGDFAAARASLEEGLALEADQPALMNTLARLLATCPEAALRDGRRALELAQRAFALEARLENAETVGMALAEMGQFEQAIRWQRGLAQQAQQRNDRAALTRLVGTLRSYQNRQPIRATLKP